MTITFSRTAGDLIGGAMQDMRVLGIGETPTDDEYAYGVRQLNLMFKSLGAEGITPWAFEEATATFAADDATVTLSPRPVNVFSASVEVSSSYSRILAQWEDDEYYRLPDRTTSGTPSAFVIDYGASAVTMTVWPVPSEETDATYRYMRVIEDVVDETSTLDVPQSWYEGLQALLAVRLTAFGEAPQDALGKAASFHEKLVNHSRPDSYTFESGLT
jgi:hypothetical protein